VRVALARLHARGSLNEATTEDLLDFAVTELTAGRPSGSTTDPEISCQKSKGVCPTLTSSPVLLRNHQMSIKDGLSYSRDDPDPVRDGRGTD